MLMKTKSALPPTAPSQASWTIEVRESDRLVLVTTQGKFTFTSLTTMMEEVHERGLELEITRFVFDDRLIRLRLTTSEIYSLPDALERLGWHRGMRVAAIIPSNSGGADDYKFFHSLATGRAFAYGLFAELDPAIAWAVAAE